jgi:predicted ATPase
MTINGEVMRELAAQYVALAEKQGATVPVMIGHRLMGISLLCTGAIAQGRAQFDHAIALYDPVKHRPLATRFGQDALVATLSVRSWALWMLGFPSGALADTKHALKDAREIGDAASLMFALYHASSRHITRGNYAAAYAVTDELAALADKKGSFAWKLNGMLVRGCLLSLTGKASDAVHVLTSGMTAARSAGATLWMPLWSSHLASANAELGQFDDAWRCIGEAMTAVETTKETWFAAEVHRMAGEITLCRRSRMRRKRKRISSVRSWLRVRSRQNPGNCARR